MVFISFIHNFLRYKWSGYIFFIKFHPSYLLVLDLTITYIPRFTLCLIYEVFSFYQSRRVLIFWLLDFHMPLIIRASSGHLWNRLPLSFIFIIRIVCLRHLCLKLGWPLTLNLLLNYQFFKPRIVWVWLIFEFVCSWAV